MDEQIIEKSDSKLYEEIPLGYKKTKVGIIPRDWKVKTLEEVALFRNGKGHEQFVEEDGEFVIVNSKFISTEGKQYKCSDQNISPLMKGDIAMVMSDVPNGKALAKCYFVEHDNKYTLNQRICAITANVELMWDKYLFYYLNRNSYFMKFDNGVGQTNLRKDEVLQCPVLLPPLNEQRKIASIITTWDKAIELKEKLIKRKKEQKDGLMQKLLTGAIRLPGYIDRWEKTELGKIGSFLKGKGISKSETSEEGLPCIRYGEIYTVHHFYIKQFCSFISNEVAENSQEIIKNDILFAGSGETAEEIGKSVAYLDNKPAYAGGDIIILRPTVEVDSLFLSYLLNEGKVAKERAKLGQGNSVVHIYPKSLSSLNVMIPSYQEQCEISKVLKTADKEIELLDQELEALKKQKIGLIQLMLTGKVRVKV